MLKSIYTILKKNVPIVLITGRGEGGLKIFVNTLVKELREKYNASSSFLKDIIGISNNGNFLFYTSGKDKEKYLDSFYNLTDEKSLKMLSNFRDELLIEKNDIISNNYITYSYCKSLNNNEEPSEKIKNFIEIDNKFWKDRAAGKIKDPYEFKTNEEKTDYNKWSNKSCKK